MSESETTEREDYTAPGGAYDGDDVLGVNGELVIDIPKANYAAGKTTTARDTNLVAGNIKNAVELFGVTGNHAPLVGDNVLGVNGALVIDIPKANYDTGKTTTASDTNLVAGNIRNAIEIFGVTGTFEEITAIVPYSLAAGTTTAVRDDGVHLAAHACDDNLSTYWRLTDAVAGDWLKVDLGAGNSVIVKALLIVSFLGTIDFTGSLSGSNDDSHWDTLINLVNAWGDGRLMMVFTPLVTTAYRYLKLMITPGMGVNLTFNELKIFTIG